MPFYRITYPGGSTAIRQASSPSNAAARALKDNPEGAESVVLLTAQDLAVMSARGSLLPVNARPVADAYWSRYRAEMAEAKRREAVRARKLERREAAQQAERERREEARMQEREARERAKEAERQAALKAQRAAKAKATREANKAKKLAAAEVLQGSEEGSQQGA